MIQLDKIKKQVIKNPYTVKFLCLLAAVILWSYVGSTKIGELKFRIPVEMRNLPESMIVLEGQEHFVSVVLNGKKDDITNLNVKNIKAIINLENSTPGERQKFPVEIVKSDIPDSVRLEVSPKKVYLTIDRKVLRRIRVQTVLAGDLKDGYVMGTVRVEPETVTITGPESVVSNMNTVETEAIPVAGLIRRSVKESFIDLRNYKNCMVDVQKVTVYLPVIGIKGMQKMTLDIKGVKGFDNYSYGLLEDSATLYLKPAKEGETIDAEDVEVFADLSVFDPDSYFTDESKNTLVRMFTLNAVIKKHRDEFAVSLIQPETVPVKIVKKPPTTKP